VGRGECMDVDSTHLGYEFYSTMANIYDAKGNTIYEGATPFPHEGVWWDGDLDREDLSSADGNGFNADVRKYSISSHSFGSRLIEFAKMTSWQVKSEYGVRPAFFGDIAGDWREEVVLEKSGVAADGVTPTCPGFVGFSTDYPTGHRIYCLMQNPAYRMQATTKGYYESAFPDFYLGYNMPIPPVSPVQKAKLTWTSGTAFDKSSPNFVLDNEKTSSAFTDGDDVMFDISGNNSAAIQLPADLAPSKLWAMNPKGKDYILGGAGKLTGTMELVKSMNGIFTLNGNQTYTGKTTISEGILAVNGSIASPIQILAKGTLAGNTIINGGITFDKALNIEGSRLMPGNGLLADKLGKMTVNGNLTLPGKTNIEFDVIPSAAYKNDSLVVNGNLTLSGINNIVIKTQNGTLPSGSFSLIKWSGTFTGTVDNFSIEGISGLPMSLVIENNTLKLVVNAVRATADIKWKGTVSSNWDYLSENFTLNNTPTYFVNNDNVLFTDTATLKTVNLTDNLTTSKTTFSNVSSAYIIKGAGGIIGSGDFIKDGKGLLDIQTVNNAYTGKTLLTNAVVQVAALSDAGAVGSLGSAAISPANMVLTNSKLIVNAVSTNSNRGYTFIGNDTINVPKSNGVVTLTGLLTGTGKLVKNGAGQLNISGSVANTYSGGTIISGGNVGLSTLLMNTSAFGSGPITLENGGKISMYYNTGDYNQKPTWNISIAAGQTGSLLASGRCIISGTISGGGTLNYTVPYVRADLVAGGANFTGKLNVINGGSGNFRITANTIGFPLANVNLSNVVDMGAYATTGASGTSATTTVRIGSLSGITGSTVGAGIWQIGSDNRDAVFAGIFTSGATVTKLGTGTWTLSGASTMTSPFTINGGKVLATNTAGSATGTGIVYVNNTGIIGGSGIISGSVVINSGGTIQPGTSAIGTLTLGSSFVLQTGSKTIIKVSGTTNDKLAITGTTVLKGTLEINNTGASYQAGNSYTILTAASITGQFDAISPAQPADGLKWNVSRINEGIISVDVADGVEDITGSSIRVYPNLVNDFCHVSIGGLNDDVKIDLINSVGVEVLSHITSSTTETYQMNLSNLNSGLYFVRITNSGKTFIRKIVKK
jgi:autotransporter-associated beta strand protein